MLNTSCAFNECLNTCFYPIYTISPFANNKAMLTFFGCFICHIHSIFDILKETWISVRHILKERQG